MDEMISRDLQHNWHPCSQMKDYEKFLPLMIARAQGNYIELQDGQKLIDAISSWWCKTLGHGHPRLKKALLQQVEKFEHVIFANTTHPVIIELSEQLARLTPSLNKVFYAGDGSCAIEIAMKMSLHARKIRGEDKKNQFIALENGYHGETTGALSVSDIGIYRSPYASMLFEPLLVSPVPYVNSKADPLWHNCEDYWQKIEKKLYPFAETATALLLEPIVQAAGGMKIYSQDFLRRLRDWTQQYNVHLIADEIMTGMGRTGKMLACEYAAIEPDFLCLSKGITSGWLPFSAVLTSAATYDLFYADYDTGKSFLHSHTFCGNALAASVALEVFTIFAEENLCTRALELEKKLAQSMSFIAERTGRLQNIRGIGTVVAADLIGDTSRRLGFEVFQQAVKLGAFLRPLGNTIYWVLPLNTPFEVVEHLTDITQQAILQAY